MTSYGVIHRVTVYSGVSNSVQLFRAHSHGGTNPYVHRVLHTGRRINVPEGTADPGQVRVTFLDKKVAADQSDRWLTRYLGDSEGRAALRGSRIEYDLSDDSGLTYQREYTGRVHGTALVDEVTIEMSTDDLMVDALDEVFDGTVPSVDWASPASFVPLGIHTGKTPDQYGPWEGSLAVPASIQSVPGIFGTTYYVSVDTRVLDTAATDALRDAARSTRTDIRAAGLAFSGLVAPEIKVGFTPTGGSEQTLTASLVHGQGQYGLASTLSWIVLEEEVEGEMSYVKAVGVSSLDGDDAIPAAGTSGTVRVYNAGAPTPAAPLHLGVGASSAGVAWPTLVKALGDGVFGGAGFTYDSTRLDALEADTTMAKIRMRVTKGKVSAQEWMDKNIWPVVGYASSVSVSGGLYPVPYDPPAVLPTTTLSASNVKSARWEQTRTTQINQVRVETFRENRVNLGAGDVRGRKTLHPQVPGTDQRGDFSSSVATDLLEETSYDRVITVRDAGAKRKKHTIVARGIRAALDDKAGSLSELQLMGQRSEFILDQFQDGPQYVTAVVLRESATKALIVGDNVLVAIPWLPDQQTLRRGGTRVMFLVEKNVNEDGTYNMRLLDRGPNSFADEPTLTSIAPNSTESRHALDVVIVPPGGRDRAELQIATVAPGVAAPAADSPDWTYAVSVSGSGSQSITLTGLPSRRAHWARVIGRGPGKLPSAYVAAQGTHTAAISPPTGFGTSVSGTMVTATWTVGDANYSVMPLLASDAGATEPAISASGFLQFPLPPGSSRFQFNEHGFTGGVTAGVKHVDVYGGDSIAAQGNATIAANKVLLPPREVVILQGRGDIDVGSTKTADFGTGVEVSWKTLEPYASSVIHHATDAGFTTPTAVSGIKATNYRISFPLDDTERYIRVFAQRLGWDTSVASSTVSADPVAFLETAAVNDGFAGGYASGSIDTDGDMVVNIGTGDADTDGAYFTLNTTAFDEPDASDTFVSRGQMPYSQDQDFILPPGSIGYLWVKFWNKLKGFGQEVQAQITHGNENKITNLAVDIRPIGVSAGGTSQAWEYDLSGSVAGGVRSINVVYGFVRPSTTANQPPPSTTFSRDYNVDITGPIVFSGTLQDGAGASQEFLAQDNAGTTIYDSNFFISVTPYDATGGAGGAGNAGEATGIGAPHITESGTGVMIEAGGGRKVPSDAIEFAPTMSAGRTAKGRGILGIYYDPVAYSNAPTDGTTDATVELQATATAAAASNGGKMAVGNGTYIITGDLTLDKKVDLQGEGSESTILRGAKVALTSGTATSGGNTTLADTGKSWTTNTYAGKWVEITSGPGVGEIREITSNTATVLTNALAWKTNPTSSSVYKVYTPSRILVERSNQWRHQISDITLDGIELIYGHTSDDYGQGASIIGCEIRNSYRGITTRWNTWLHKIIGCEIHDCAIGVHYDFDFNPIDPSSGAGAAMRVTATDIFDCYWGIFVDEITTDGYDIQLSQVNLEHCDHSGLRVRGGGDGVIQISDVHFELNNVYSIDAVGATIFVKGGWIFAAGSTHTAIFKVGSGTRLYLSSMRLQWDSGKLVELLTGGFLLIDSDSIFSNNSFFGQGSAPMATALSTGGKILNGGSAFNSVNAKVFCALRNQSTSLPTLGASTTIETIQAYERAPRVYEFDLEITAAGTNNILRIYVNPLGALYVDIVLPAAVGIGRFRAIYDPGVSISCAGVFNGVGYRDTVTETVPPAPPMTAVRYIDFASVGASPGTMVIHNLFSYAH